MGKHSKIAFSASLVVLGLFQTSCVKRSPLADSLPRLTPSATAAEESEPSGEPTPLRAAKSITREGASRIAALPVESSLGEWRPIGPYNYAGKAFDVAVHPQNPDYLYVAGGSGGGLWRTTDGGNTWQLLTDRREVNFISCVTIHPNQPSIIAACVGGPSNPSVRHGLLLSNDGGQHWDWIGPDDGVSTSFYQAVFDPQHPEFIFAASEKAVYRTRNRGKTWSRVLTYSGDNYDYFSYMPSLTMKPDDPNVLIVAQTNIGIMRTSDGGDSWQRVDQSMDPTPLFGSSMLAWSSSNPRYIYCERDVPGMDVMNTYTSQDAGLTWHKTVVINAHQQDRYDMSLAVDPRDPQRVLAANSFIHESTDGFQTTRMLPSQPHVDHLRILFSPSNPNILYAANDGGIWRSDDNGGSWRRIDVGVPTTISFGFDVNPANGSIFLSVADYNPSLQYTPSLGWGTATVGYEWTMFYIDPKNSNNVVFAGFSTGTVNPNMISLGLSVDGGTTWKFIDPDQLGPRPYRTVVRFHPTKAGTFYFLTNKVWVTTDYGATWTDLGVRSQNNYFLDLLIDPNEPNSLYVTDLEVLHRSTDGGKTWSVLAGDALFRGCGQEIAAAPDRIGEFYLTGCGAVYYVTGRGSTAIPIGSNFPSGLLIDDIQTDPAHPNRVLVGTSAGVLYSDDRGSSWKTLGTNLPIVSVWEIRIKGDLIYAGTSQGMWEFSSANLVNLPSPPTLNTNAESDHSVSVSWTPSAQASGTRIYRDNVQVFTGSARQYVDGVLAPGTTYCYTARETFGPRDGPVSSASCVTTLGTKVNNGPQNIEFQLYAADAGTFAPLQYAGILTLGPSGDVTSTGPVYKPLNDNAPNIMLDTARNTVLMSPGTFSSVKSGAVIGVPVPASGTYDVQGAFARANDALNAGDGVLVAIFINNHFDAPAFSGVILSDNAVDPNNYFTGSGVAPFHLSLPLAQGDTVQFGVFSGPKLLDGTFDLTALQFTIAGSGTSISLP